MSAAAATPLNAEQAAALRAIQAGRNIFLTGAGGTGKTHTIRAVTAWATAAGLRYSVTALTGCAALLLNCGAKTLHSWAGIGLARESPADLAAAVLKNKRAARRWIDTQLLIVDEISMAAPELLEKLDCVARRIRKRPDHPFGGLQLVLAGDFCQLPPVARDISGSDVTTQRFAFQLSLWSTLVQETHYLQQIQRQSDPVFQRILTEARLGALSPESIATLETRMGLPWQENEIRPTLLFNRNAEVDEVNRRNMEVLDGERVIFDVQTVVMETATRRAVPYARGDGHASLTMASPEDADVQHALQRLDADAPYDPSLTLAIGAQVMLLVNLDQDAGLVNGSRGIVTGFSPGGLPLVKFRNQGAASLLIERKPWWLPDHDGIGRAQIPLKVAYAITIHKSQGATLDSALVDIGASTFEFGQAYVALSRVKSLEGLYVWKLDPRKIRCHPAVVEFYTGLASTSTSTSTSTAAATTPAVAPEDADPAPPDFLQTADLSPAWRAITDPFLASPAGRRLQTTLTARAAVAPIAPAAEDVFAALRACPDPASCRVIFLGQDPYPTAGHAHGLAFSVRPSVVKLPPSLTNIFKELQSDLSLPSPPSSGSLLPWTAQGVLLLNTVLTVTIGAARSHAGLGWEELTAQLLAAVLQAAPHVVIVAWGNDAQRRLDHPAVARHKSRHTILTAPHPSPLSAYTGFFGSRPFSQTNAALTAHGQTPIAWCADSSSCTAGTTPSA
jgi:ATP-dependent DNA helicase PIF1